ncbi:MAG TPA: type II toxin-antitoxin system prevent-host-death family antitoxin [Micrococcaceae bacterium]|jgi:prevent-host-death family protein|nr:type II toxin-antitoxin system prevent-host-death family antitoxin [Micrococcaceae bacterium]
MKDVGLRELRQHASDVVRRAEAGETITITVSGRTAAVLGPVYRGAWRRYEEIQDIFAAPSDPGWERDLHAFDEIPTDPWARS